MRCQEAFEQMSAALDGEAVSAGQEVEHAEGEGLRQHLLSCATCRIQQVTLGVIDGRLRQLRTRPLATPRALRDRVHQQCRQNRASCAHADRSRPGLTLPVPMPTTIATPITPRPRLRSRTWGMAFTGAAAALFALFVLGTGPRGGIFPGAGSSPAAGVASSAGATGGAVEGACRLALAGGSPVALACASDGRRGARDVMERLTQLARTRGLDLQCTSCHLDERSFQLLSGAREKFASLLEATRT
jgi:hypothetical protein